MAREAEGAKHRKLEADFQKGQAELGTIDHAVNVHAAPEKLKDLTHSAVPLVLRIEQAIVQAIKGFPVSGHPNYFSEKQRIESQVARTIHPFVMEVEEIADQYATNTTLFIHGYRTLVADMPVGDDDGLETLRTLPDAFSGPFAGVFALGSKAFRDRLLFMRGMHGHQQDLSRITHRQATALTTMSDCCERIHRFCSGELKKLVDARIRKESKR